MYNPDFSRRRTSRSNQHWPTINNNQCTYPPCTRDSDNLSIREFDVIVRVDTFLVRTAVDEIYALDCKVWVDDSGDNADVRRSVGLASSVTAYRLLRPALSQSYSGEGSQSDDEELHIVGGTDRDVHCSH